MANTTIPMKGPSAPAGQVGLVTSPSAGALSFSGNSPGPIIGGYVGFGSVTQGADDDPGGKTTYTVTNLNDSGSGSFREAVSVDGREIDFSVGGEITLGSTLQITNSYLTINGNTAPSPGITLNCSGQRLCLESNGSDPVHDIIINNIRAYGNGSNQEGKDLWELDGSSGWPVYNVILDHCTLKSSSDGMCDIYGDVHDVTISHCLFMDSIQGQHTSQASGTRDAITFFQNVYSGVSERQPRIGYQTTRFDYVNNVIYGWGWLEAGGVGMNPNVAGYTPTANVEYNIYHYVSGLSGGGENSAFVPDGNLDGDWYFNGNDWPPGEVDANSTAGQTTIPVNAQVTPYATSQLANLVVPTAGTHFPTAAETTALSTVSAALGNNLVVLPGVANLGLGGEIPITIGGSASPIVRSPAVGALSVSGLQPQISGPELAEPATGTLSLTGVAPVVPVESTTAWLGIPDPAGTLGYDPITVTEPADHANWPSGEAVGDYYIDSGHGSATDTANTYGFPDKPRVTIPTSLTITGGNKCVVVGDGESYSGGNISVSSSGASSAAGDQAWFIGRSATDITVNANRPLLSNRRIAVTGDFTVLSDVWVNEQDDDNAPINVNGNSSTVRNFELQGFGTLAPSSGTCLSVGSGCVAYNGIIRDQGKWDTDDNADLHGCKISGTKSNVWVLELLGYHIQGDTIQIGDANGNASLLHHIYLGGISGYDNKENVIDTKDCTDVIISGGYGHSMDGQWGDDEGADVTIHDESNYVWVINRLSYDCRIGVAVSGSADNTYIVNSVFRDFTDTSGADYYDGGTAIQARQGAVTVANCTFHNCRKAIEFPVGVSSVPQVTNCIFQSRAEVGVDDWDLAFENSTDANNADVDYNLYDDAVGGKCRIGGTEYTSLASWQGSTAHDDNSQEDDALFTNEGADDFTLQAGSPAVDAGNTTIPLAFSDFETRYGFSIEKDKNLDDRPASATDWDIGAFERQ